MIALVGGWVALVPLAVAPLALATGLGLQALVRRHARIQQTAANQKAGLLVEAVDGAESLKANGGERMMQARWNTLVDEAAMAERQSRDHGGLAQQLTVSLQQLGYVATIAFGAWLVSENQITMGGLLACSILSNRALAPLIQLPGVMMQWAHARVALDSLDQLLALANEEDDREQALKPGVIDPSLRFERVRFVYARQAQPALDLERLDIRPPAFGPAHRSQSRVLRPGPVQCRGRAVLLLSACGSLNRSMPNYEAGARTPMAAVFSALILVVLILLSAPLLAHIPYAAIAGLLLLVAWTLLDVPRWRWLARVDRNEAMIAAATLAATLFIRMEVAIMLGALLSLSAYLYRTSRPAMRIMGFDAKDPARHFIVREGHDSALPECPQLRLLRMEGSVYFGAAAYVDERLAALRQNGAAHLLVMTKSMNFIDQAGAQVWEDELKRRRAAGGDLYFHRPRPEVLATWRRTGFIERLGQDHIFPDKTTAIASIYQRLDPAVCRACEARCFRECGPPGTAHQSGQADSAAPPEAKRETS